MAKAAAKPGKEGPTTPAADAKVDSGCSTDGAGALTCASFATTGSSADSYTELVAPASPSTGKGSVWFDSTHHFTTSRKRRDGT